MSVFVPWLKGVVNRSVHMVCLNKMLVVILDL